MKKLLYYSFLSGMALLALSGETQALTCTAAPSCADLGYTKTSCAGGGGVKCPFDSSKMFCIREGMGSEYKFVNAISRYQIAYSDGTTAKYYDDKKTPIGIVTYVHPTKSKKHGLIMSLRPFTIQNQAEAHKICAAYTTAGTMAGDWHLPDIGELATMSAGDTVESNDEFTKYRDALKTIPTAGDLGMSFSFFYGNSTITDGVDKQNTSNTQGSFTSHSLGYSSRKTNWYNSTIFVSDSQSADSTSNAYISTVNYANGITSVAKTRKMQFRCVAYF